MRFLRTHLLSAALVIFNAPAYAQTPSGTPNWLIHPIKIGSYGGCKLSVVKGNPRWSPGGIAPNLVRLYEQNLRLRRPRPQLGPDHLVCNITIPEFSIDPEAARFGLPETLEMALHTTVFGPSGRATDESHVNELALRLIDPENRVYQCELTNAQLADTSNPPAARNLAARLCLGGGSLPASLKIGILDTTTPQRHLDSVARNSAGLEERYTQPVPHSGVPAIDAQIWFDLTTAPTAVINATRPTYRINRTVNFKTY